MVAKTLEQFDKMYHDSLGEYSVIMADPPWEYNNQGTRASADKHYNTISQQELRALPVARLGSMPCALFLWATWPNMQNALDLIDAWGFEYKTLAWEWRKTNKAGDKYIMGLGNYTRSNPEPCLLAFKKVKTKGKIMRVADRSVPAWIDGPRRKHSQKPDQQYEYIDRLYPNVPRLELFATQTWPGWEAWGDFEGSIDIWPS